MSAVTKAPTSVPSGLPKIRHGGKSRHDHVVQFYGDDSALLDSLVEFIGPARKRPVRPLS